jgi:tetratricopeptide (TPR) repeat protein
MFVNRSFVFWTVKKLLLACFVLATMQTNVFAQTPAQLLRQGSNYQASDDTSDRAPELYREVIMKHPKSAEAESAQFFLGGYYNRKFFILEARNQVQDWGSFNRAEEALYAYLDQYPRGFYLADSYHTLALIALRRNYSDKAISLWTRMKEVADKDKKVYIYRLTWSTNSDDVIKGYCDTKALAEASFDVMGQKSSFADKVSSLTNWARNNCSSSSSSK